jgi:hypothetical protein
MFVYADEFLHYKYFLLRVVSSIVKYVFTKLSIISFEETQKRGAFSIHKNP